ncbi:MAG: hypothetical protein QOJ80_1749 [Mycobacterium sp.]|nr:hypothetical protein [Mycobacterium sp.]
MIDPATHNTAPNEFVEVAGVTYAYRRFGAPSGVPVLFLQHLRGSMDYWDPAVTDGIAARRPVILFDNEGVGLSTGQTPDTVDAMADNAAAFVRASKCPRSTSSDSRSAATPLNPWPCATPNSSGAW